MVRRILYLSILLLLPAAISSAQENSYRITYTINIDDDGTAIWNVEYRTLLESKTDTESFENYTMLLESVYLKEFKELMTNSVSEASNTTSRKMIAGGFKGEAEIQTAPTGTYGVVHYSFKWTNFAQKDTGGNMNIGDIFVGGLYLSKDNTLIILYPSGHTLENVTPQPDQVRDGLIWYGLRSFETGEPRISLLKDKISGTYYVIIISFAVITAACSFLIMRKVRRNKGHEAVSETGEACEIIQDPLLMDLEDRIVMLLKESNGSMYQSEIGKKLGLPKSTVSSALNGLHCKNIIQKIKKGRENLIRLV
jgi:hypothetical protein